MERGIKRTYTRKYKLWVETPYGKKYKYFPSKEAAQDFVEMALDMPSEYYYLGEIEEVTYD